MRLEVMHKKISNFIAYKYIIERTLDLKAKDLMKRIKHYEQDNHMPNLYYHSKDNQQIKLTFIQVVMGPLGAG